MDELLAAGTEFDVNMYELSDRHDIRPLVLRTALTYLEFLGVLRQGTPCYAGYRLRLLMPPEQIVAQFKGEHAVFINDLLLSAKKGRTWLSLNPAEVAAAMCQERQRVVRAIEVLHERGCAVVEAADARQRYKRLRPAENAARFGGRTGQSIRAP